MPAFNDLVYFALNYFFMVNCPSSVSLLNLVADEPWSSAKQPLQHMNIARNQWLAQIQSVQGSKCSRVLHMQLSKNTHVP